MAFLAAPLLLSIFRLAIAQSAVETCVGDQYLSKNGLNFYTGCSAQAGNTHANSTAGLVWSEYTDSLEHCMDQCALTRPRCYAVVYSDGACYEYDEDLFPRNATGEKAIAEASQLATPDAEALACPYDPFSFQTVNGEEFQILCDADFVIDGGDFCAYESYPSKCTRHADSFEECLQFCSEAHPLCKGVTWNPDMWGGFGDCYLKAHPKGATTNPYAVCHSAMITQTVYEEISTACPEVSQYEMEGTNYTVACKTGRVDTQNITSVHSNSLDDCLGECSSSIADGCLGVLFDMSMLGGYRNCYLLNDTGSAVTGGANMTFAERMSQSSRGSLHDSEEEEDGGQGSKAWIAGPVVGAVVALALLIGGFWWWRRRQRQRRQRLSQRAERQTEESKAPAEMIEPTESGEVGAESKPTHPAEMYSESKPTQAVEKDAEPIVRHELSDPNSEKLYPPEKA